MKTQTNRLHNYLVSSMMVVFLMLLISCATPVQHNTQSGRPEVTISGKVGEQVIAEISNLMINNGYNVKSSSNSLLVFEKPIEKFMASVLLGSNYDGTPYARITASVIESPSNTRVVLTFAAVTNPGSAFERITPMNQSQDTIAYQNRLNEIKSRLEY